VERDSNYNNWANLPENKKNPHGVKNSMNESQKGMLGKEGEGGLASTNWKIPTQKRWDIWVKGR